MTDDIVQGDGPTAMCSKIGSLLNELLTCTRGQHNSHMIHLFSINKKKTMILRVNFEIGVSWYTRKLQT